MTQFSSLEHLQILRNYQFKYNEIKQKNDQALREWLKEIITYFQSAVFQSEVGNTEVIKQMNIFVVEAKKLQDSEELGDKFQYVVQQAKNIIDEAIHQLDSSKTNP